ncbi:MAG: VCBS repeat-containing protein, partial [Chitinophagaceae bacterium]|nr:VCBS repeat-containing protein [Chitinophagaceae bacterium]
LDDIVIGGSTFNPPSLFCQQSNGKFIEKSFMQKKDSAYKKYSRDEGILLFDADGDNDLDLYVASGGFKYDYNNINYQDILYINNGRGNYTKADGALPLNHTSKLCVKAFDYNKDGKPDLFVSGRVYPWQYPKPVSSVIYRNDSHDGKVKFTDVTAEVAPELNNIGMVCDALFSDFDNDQQVDLILAGEWMPVTFFKNINGKFKNVTAGTGIAAELGWWTSIVAGDFRHTGKTDYIVGNAGLNTLYQASEKYPVYITAKDFDNTGGYVAVPSIYLPALDGQMKEFPSQGRDAVLEKIPFMKKRFNNYHSFATATMDEVFTSDMQKDAIRLKATNLQSCYLRNEGGGKFTIIPLPGAAQVSTLNGMITDDYDEDGNLDVLINGNDYGPEVSVGRCDALNGLLLKGDGNGNFVPLSIQESGIYIPANGKALIKLLGPSGNYLVAASQYRGGLKLFEMRKKINPVRVNNTDAFAEIKYNNGRSEKVEFYHGDSFLSQSARFLYPGKNVVAISITDSGGNRRTVK